MRRESPIQESPEISDSMCGANHAAMGDMGKNRRNARQPASKAVASTCLSANGKVYAIRNQDFAALASNAGAKIQVAGDVDKDGKTIAITKIADEGK